MATIKDSPIAILWKIKFQSTIHHSLYTIIQPILHEQINLWEKKTIFFLFYKRLRCTSNYHSPEGVAQSCKKGGVAQSCKKKKRNKRKDDQLKAKLICCKMALLCSSFIVALFHRKYTTKSNLVHQLELIVRGPGSNSDTIKLAVQVLDLQQDPISI